jgi:hypothetical protein
LRIFADENVSALVVEGLRRAGHDVTWGCEFAQGATDLQRIADAERDGRIILTEDQDFAEHLILHRHAMSGLIRFDLHGLSREGKAARILAATIEIGDSALGKFTLIEHARIRTRAID